MNEIGLLGLRFYFNCFLNRKLILGVCGWIDTVNGFNLPLAFSREVMFFVPKLAWMLVFADFWFFSILRVLSKSNGYLGGYYKILIGTLNPPNDPP